jgi:hypothetical protein
VAVLLCLHLTGESSITIFFRLAISTEECDEYQQNGKELHVGLWDQFQKEMSASLVDPSKPFLGPLRCCCTKGGHQASNIYP